MEFLLLKTVMIKYYYIISTYYKIILPSKNFCILLALAKAKLLLQKRKEYGNGKCTNCTKKRYRNAN